MIKQDTPKATVRLFKRQSKRGKSRRVYLPRSALAFVERWLLVRGTEPGTLFCRIRKGSRLQLDHMHPDAIWRILQKRG